MTASQFKPITGSCLCGQIKVAVEGEPVASGLCHCFTCRKLSGSTYTTNIVVKPEDWKVTGGIPVSFGRPAESGNVITNYFCPLCYSPLWGEGGFGPNKVVRMGLMDDDSLEKTKMQLEVYSERRVSWIPPVEGSIDVIGMGEVAKVAGA